MVFRAVRKPVSERRLIGGRRGTALGGTRQQTQPATKPVATRQMGRAVRRPVSVRRPIGGRRGTISGGTRQQAQPATKPVVTRQMGRAIRRPIGGRSGGRVSVRPIRPGGTVGGRRGVRPVRPGARKPRPRRPYGLFGRGR